MAGSQTFTLNIKAVANMQDVISNIQQIQNALGKLKMPDSLKSSFSKTFGDLEKEAAKYQELLAKGFKTKGDSSAFTKSGNNILRLYDELVSKINSIDDSNLKNMFKDLGTQEIQRLKEELNGLQQSLKTQLNGKDFTAGFKNSLSDIKDKFKETDKAASELAAKLQKSTFNTFTKNLTDGRLDLAQKNLESMQEKIAALGGTKSGELEAWIGNLTTKFNELKDSSDIQNTVNQLEQIKSKLSGAEAQVIQDMINGFKQFQGTVADSNKEVEKLVVNEQQVATSTAEFNRELGQVKSRIQYFLGLNNAINLVKRAIRGAVETIKDLDKAMTETAVVTDFTVSDMWQQLPEYTKRANELGVTTQAAYEAATLYYQQGLNNEEVNALSVETLKMARIAGLDAAEATDRMTNALRGFNMELDAQSAQRVDDVYSELAANTASNVDEISTAMTKVASLAHSANMEFETTAAFLAQIIETTRESAETAGTALKTVVARFSEVKKLVDTNQLKGQDEEGQVVDVNKVSAALRTAGIDLNKYFLGEVGLDDIFMELASKWDSLTSVQQRYIATQAAGSRQQSRFIALMQDYARTQELVGKAYNAEGASARQFEKTQESLESKLARLKNAWNEFLMGLANSTIVKAFVDGLTTLLNIVNKLTTGFNEGTSFILKWIAALSTFAGIKTLFRGGGLIDRGLMSLLAGTGMGNAAVKSGLLSGLVFGGKGRVAQGLTGEALASAQAAAGAKRVPLIFGSGSLLTQAGKGLWGGAQSLGSLIFGIGGAKGAGELAAGGLMSGGAGLGAGLAGLTTALGAVAVAVGAVIAAYQSWLRLTPEGHLKQAKQLAETMNTVADNTQKNASEFKKATENYKDYDNAVKSASTTAEYQKAISDRTNYVQQLMENNPNIAQYVTAKSENGEFTLTINEQELEKATKDAAETASQAAVDASFANALVAGKQADVYAAQLMRAGVNMERQTIFDGEGARALTGQELAKYGQIQTQLEAARAQQAAYAQQAFARQLEGSGLDDDLSNLLSNVLAKSFNEDQYLDEINKQRSENWWAGNASKNDLRAQYFQLYGQQADSKMSRKELAQAVATRQVDNKRAEDTKAAAEAVKSGRYDDILKAIAGEIDFSEAQLELEETTKKLKDFSEITGISTDDLKAQIKQGQKARQEIKKNNQIGIYDRFLRSGAANERYSERIQGQEIPTTTAVDNYKAFLDTLDFEGLAAVEKITSQAESLLGDKLGEFMTELPDLYGTGQFNAVQNLFDNIDLDNPIQAFLQLQQYANDTTSAVGKYAAAIREANADLFTSSNLVQSFVASADYEGITEQLGKFIEENEAITADNINELAASCSDLATLLDEDVVSAQALAEAFTLLETGVLTFDQITDALLKALDAGKSFETVIAEVKGWIEDFDQGTDLAEGADHVVSVLEDLKGYVDNWEFGNEPVENIYDHLFGKGAYQDYLSTFKERFNPEEAEKYLTGQIERFTQLFENEGLGAIQELAGKIPGLTSLGNNLFDWDLSAVGSTTEAINQVANALGITEQAAESLVLAWQTHIPGLRTEWNNLAFDEQVSAYASNLGNAKAITEQELSALAAATGHTVDEIKAKLAELATTDNVNIPVIVNFQDTDGNALTGDALYNKFLNTFGSWSNTNHMQIDWGTELADTVIKEFENGIKGYDPSQVLSYFTDRGLNTEQATEMANRAVEAAGGKFTKAIEVPVTYVTKDDSGEEIYKTETKTVTVEADTVEGLDAAINTALQTAQYDSVATAIATQDFSGLSDSIAAAGEAGGARAAASVKSQIEAQQPSVTVSVTYVPTNPEVLSGGAAGGIVVGVAKGGQVNSYASGSAANRLSPGVALTGEEGPEIVWNKQKGYAYITGEHHPQFQNLQPGDRVFNAQETRKILSGSLAKGGLIDSYASGGWKPDTGKKSSGGGGGKSGSGGADKTPEEWKNELDWLYNLMEDIAELERDQKAIEEQYEDALKDQTKTGKDLYNLLVKQLGNLYTQLNHQTFALEKREQEMREFMDITNDKDQYLWYNWQDRTIEIDWDAIDQITDEEEYKHVKELIDEAEEIQDKMDDADDAIMDIMNQIQELENIWRDTFTDFEDRVYDAIVKSYQRVIDEYSELNDTLNNSNQQILDSLQKQISLQRQIRDNTKTEEEITNDEARLAYLRRDTSGGNDLAALQLEKELSEQRQNYEDTLVDQAVSRLQEDNDAAAQQRQQQIDIMQAQLDYQSQNGEFNAAVRELLESAMGGEGELLTNSDLVNLLKEQENWNAMSDVSKEVWDEELNGTFKEVAAFLLKENSEQNGTFYTALTKAVEGVSTAIGSYSQAMVKLGNQVASAASGGGGGGGGGSGGGGSPNAPGGNNNYYYNSLATGQKVYSSTIDATTLKKNQALMVHYGGTVGKKYATGGLADVTGLAWLDGTPSEPEYVLNARQTDAFLKLADVLPSMMGSGTSTQTNTFGSTYITMPITLESVSPDYDVDRMVDLLKDKLYDAGSYRNVNSLSFIR